MAKKEKTVAELEQELAAAQAAKAELEGVVEGQSLELERLGAEKKAGKTVISVGKKKYQVLAPKARLFVGSKKDAKGKFIDGKYQDVVVADLEKKENKHLLDALLALDGQQVLAEV